MIFCAISIQNTQGPIGPGQWKLGLRSHLQYFRYCLQDVRYPAALFSAVVEKNLTSAVINVLAFRKNGRFKTRVRRFRQKFFRLKAKQSKTKSVLHAHEKFFFTSFCFEFFASNQSKMKTSFFRFVSVLKISRFASNFLVFLQSETKSRFFALFCFKAKRNKRFFFIFFISLGTDCPRISLYPFLLCSFCFFSILFSLHFIFVSLKMQKQVKKHFFRIEAKTFCFHFPSIRFEAKMTAVFAFFLVFASFHFRFTLDFYLSHRCENKRKKHLKRTNF